MRFKVFGHISTTATNSDMYYLYSFTAESVELAKQKARTAILQAGYSSHRIEVVENYIPRSKRGVKC